MGRRLLHSCVPVFINHLHDNHKPTTSPLQTRYKLPTNQVQLNQTQIHHFQLRTLGSSSISQLGRSLDSNSAIKEGALIIAICCLLTINMYHKPNKVRLQGSEYTETDSLNGGRKLFTPLNLQPCSLNQGRLPQRLRSTQNNIHRLIYSRQGIYYQNRHFSC